MNSSDLDLLAIDHKWLADEISSILGAIEDASNYLDYIEAARDQKSKNGYRSPSFEHEVLTNARRAERSTRRFLGGMLQVLKHLKSAGLVDQAISHWTIELEKRGKISFADYWRQIIDNEAAQARLREAGVSAPTINRLSEAAARLTQPLEVHNGHLIMREEGRPTLVFRRRRLSGGTVEDLLYINQFDNAAELFQLTNVVPGIVLTRSHGDEVLYVDPFENFLALATNAQRRVVAHVRKLEDSGLDVHEGSDVIGILVLVGAALWVVSALISIVCLFTHTKGTVCDIASIIASLGAFLILGRYLNSFKDAVNVSKTQNPDGSYG
jgi:hypothetical protein